MLKKLKLPKFKNEDEERDFWAKIDLSEYYEPSDMVPDYLLNRVKEKANAINVPYQSLIKKYIEDGVFA